MVYNNNIFANIEQLSDEQLVDMIDASAENYTEDALNIARQIAEERGGLDFLRSKITKFKNDKYDYFRELSDEVLIEMIDVKHIDYSEEELNILKDIAEERGGLEILRLKNRPNIEPKGSIVFVSKRGASFLLGIFSLLLGIAASGLINVHSEKYVGPGLNPEALKGFPPFFLIIAGVILILSSIFSGSKEK